jgi:hypothetical protein
MEQSPFDEADSHSSSKKFLAFFVTKISLACSQEPAPLDPSLR